MYILLYVLCKKKKTKKVMYVEQKKNKKVVYNEKSIGSSNTISTNYLFCNKSHFCGLKNMLYIFLSFLLSFDFLHSFFSFLEDENSPV